MWDVADPARPAALGRPLGIVSAVSSVAFSPDGHTLASGSDGSGHGDSPGTIQLWNVTGPARSTPLGQPLS